MILEEHPELRKHPDDLPRDIDRMRSVVKGLRGLNGDSSRNLPNRVKKLSTTGGDHEPKILVFDIETTPMLSYHWRTFKENISPVQVVEYSQVLCWAAKWLHEDTIMFDSQKEDEDDRRICESLWDLCDQADIIVAHNGQAFDMSFMRTRWLFYKMVPPSPTKIVDTLKISRKQFGFPNNKLETLVRYLDIGGKLANHGFQTWLDCMGCTTKKAFKEAWKLMEEYNVRDVVILEEFYLRARAWDTRHPNVALFYEADEKHSDPRCVCCGSRELKHMSQSAYTAVSVFEARRCKNCGKVMRVGAREARPETILRNIL